MMHTPCFRRFSEFSVINRNTDCK